MLNTGDCIKVKTRVKNDTFGTCFYEILETGLPAPEKGRENETDGVKAMMLGGSGPAAREGLTVIDSQWNIGREIIEGIVEVLPSKQAALKELAVQPKASLQLGVDSDAPRPSTGVMEID